MKRARLIVNMPTSIARFEARTRATTHPVHLTAKVNTNTPVLEDHLKSLLNKLLASEHHICCYFSPVFPESLTQTLGQIANVTTYNEQNLMSKDEDQPQEISNYNKVLCPPLTFNIISRIHISSARPPDPSSHEPKYLFRLYQRIILV